MRRPTRANLTLSMLVLASASCTPATPPDHSAVRTERRAFDGAPPTVPHLPLGGTCVACHSESGLAVAELGFAPPSPHGRTDGLSERSRCLQCHVHQTTETVFVTSNFVGLQQDLRRGRRLNPLAPPVLPHQVLMRENCAACHAGPGAREEIRTSHPERLRCRQCHLEARESGGFQR